LKTHPDKSKLDPKYFLFYSQAYRRLFGIYEFQNKSKPKNKTTDSFFNQEKSDLLDKLKFQNTKEFNLWFNKQFEQHSVEDQNGEGYGDWLKSDDDVCDVGKVSKADMASVFEQQKKQVKSIVQYDGVNDNTSRVFSGSVLGKATNFTSDTYSDFTGRVVSITGMLQSFRRAERVRGAVNTQRRSIAVDARKTDRRRNKVQPGAVTFGRARLV
jgi:hypothetical protein